MRPTRRPTRPALPALALALAWLTAAATFLHAGSGHAYGRDRYFTPTPGYCSDYARDYVHRHGGRGGAVDGAVRGALGGAVIGGIIDGKDGARRGAGAAGAIGGIRGSRAQRRDNDWLYHRAYEDCMRRERYD